jgi:hypothetical protein
MNTEVYEPPKNKIITGVAFIAIGIIWLLDEFIGFNFGSLILPGLGIFFLIWGATTREGGLLIPGGVISGLGVGVGLVSSFGVGGENAAGVILLGLATGFASIILTTWLFTDETHWWPIFPVAAIGLVGTALFLGGQWLSILTFAERFWPVALIIVGVVTIFKRK